MRTLWKFLLICLLLLLLLPSILSLPFAKPFLEKQLSRQLQANVTFAKASLGWFTGASFFGCTYKKNTVEITADTLTLNTPLYALPFKTKSDLDGTVKKMELFFNKTPFLVASGIYKLGFFEGILKGARETDPSIPIKGHYDGSLFRLDTPLFFHTKLSSDSLASLEADQFTLSSEAEIETSVTKLALSFAGKSKIEEIEARIALKNVQVVGPPKFGALSIHQFFASVNKKEGHSYQFKSNVVGDYNELPLDVVAEGTMSQRGKLLEAQIDAKKFPLGPIGYAFNAKEPLETLLGKSASVNLSIHNTLYTLSFSSPTTQIDKALFTVVDILTLKEPTKIQLVLKEFSYGLQGPIIKNFPAEIFIEKLTLPEMDLKLTVKTGKGASVFHPRLGNILLENKELKIAFKESRGKTQKIEFILDPFKGEAEVKEDQAVSVSLNGVGLSLKAQTKTLARPQDKSVFDLSLQQFKLSHLKCMVTLEPRILNTIDALTGQKIDGKIHLGIENGFGTFLTTLQGANGSLSLAGKLERGILVLDEPFVSELKISEPLKLSLLAEVIPFLAEVQSSDHPLSLRIDPKGFAIPLIPLDFSRAKSPYGKMVLGTLYFSGKKELGKILSLLESAPSEKISLWFTPLYFSFDAGKFTVQRVDFLAQNRFPMAVFGHVNLEKKDVDFTLGLTAPTLKQLLKLNTIDPKSFLEIPYRGKLGKAKIDKTKIALQTAALLAKDKGSKEGNLVGIFLDIAGGKLQKGQIPPPTTSPLPWEDQ